MVAKLLSLTFLSCLYIAHAQRTPTISFISPEQIKDIGGVVELDCSVQYAQEYPVLWIKVNSMGESLPISTTSVLIVRDSRFALRYDKSSSTYTLQDFKALQWDRNLT